MTCLCPLSPSLSVFSSTPNPRHTHTHVPLQPAQPPPFTTNSLTVASSAFIAYLGTRLYAAGNGGRTPFQDAGKIIAGCLENVRSLFTSVPSNVYSECDGSTLSVVGVQSKRLERIKPQPRAVTTCLLPLLIQPTLTPPK